MPKDVSVSYSGDGDERRDGATHVYAFSLEQHLALDVLVVRALAATLLPGLHVIEVITIIDVQDELVRDVLLDLRGFVVSDEVKLGVLGKVR